MFVVPPSSLSMHVRSLKVSYRKTQRTDTYRNEECKMLL